MKKKIADPLLMVITILIIVGFQVYWIKNNYDREKRLLSSKAGIVFRTAIFELQASRLNRSLGKKGDVHSDIKIIYKDDTDDPPLMIKNSSSEQVVGISDAIRKQVADSVFQHTKKKSQVLISINNASISYKDSSGEKELHENFKGGNAILKMFYGIDSLKNPIKKKDIIAAVQKAFTTEKLPVSFSVDSLIAKKEDSVRDDIKNAIENLDEVTVGFINPVTYKLQLTDTAGYLFKKLWLPLLFSLFLIAITIFSFWLLYRNLNRQKRLTEIKNEFIGNITHELKTPISTVSVAIEALQNFNALQNPERTKEYLVIANNELHRLGLLVDKVLRLSMFEKQEVELQLQRFDSKQLVNEVLETMKLQFEKQQASVTLHTTGDDYMLTADRMHITSVIYNLLDNALKYSTGAPVITISLAATTDMVSLQITDKGIGIPPAYTNKIFDKFFRVPSGNQHNVKGYGLGLSYVAHIIAQHKGTIDVKTEEGKGTSFTIQLPKQHENN